MEKEKAKTLKCPFKFGDVGSWYPKNSELDCLTDRCMAWVGWTEEKGQPVDKGVCGLIPGMKKLG